MARFTVNQPIDTLEPRITVDPTLSIGFHRFQLLVTDSSGRRSQPALATVEVRTATTDGSVVIGGVITDPLRGGTIADPVSGGGSVTDPLRARIVTPPAATQTPSPPQASATPASATPASRRTRKTRKKPK